MALKSRPLQRKVDTHTRPPRTCSGRLSASPSCSTMPRPPMPMLAGFIGKGGKLGHSRVRGKSRRSSRCVPPRCNFITPFDFFASSNTMSVDIMRGLFARPSRTCLSDAWTAQIETSDKSTGGLNRSRLDQPDEAMRVARNFRTIMTLALLAASTVSARAQTNWTGAVSSDWFTAGNWSAGVPFTAVTNASANIDTVTPNSTALTSVGARALNLTVGENGIGMLVVQNGGTLTDFGGFVGDLPGSRGTATVSGAGVQDHLRPAAGLQPALPVLIRW